MPKRRGGPKTPAGKAKSLANLAPPFRPGESGNPAGRPNAGASVIDWLNVMAEWTRADLRTVVGDDTLPANKLAAARLWLDASSTDRTSAGLPIATSALSELMDRLDGKPRQAVQVTSDTTIRRDNADAEAMLADPDIAEQFRSLARAAALRHESQPVN